MSISSNLQRLVSSGALRPSDGQMKVAMHLTRLCSALDVGATNTPDPSSPPRVPRGLFLHGSVGSGKSMLMNMFHSSLQSGSSRRTHFHVFMEDVHKRIRRVKEEEIASNPELENRTARQIIADSRSGKIRGGQPDPIRRVGEEMAREAKVLCFDEFQVTDVADAVILTTLFDTLFREGVVVVATSNRSIDSLYEGGVNEEYFKGTRELIKNYCKEMKIDEENDFRVDKGGDAEGQGGGYWFSDPADLKSMIDMDSLGGVELELPWGRRFKLESGSIEGRTLLVDFDTLCSSYVGSAEYRAIALNFDEVYLESVPVMTLKEHDKARRFITFIDEMYEGGVRMAIQTEGGVGVGELMGEGGVGGGDEWIGDDDVTAQGVTGSTKWLDVRTTGGRMMGELASVKELRWAFKRAESRMRQMCGALWWDREKI